MSSHPQIQPPLEDILPKDKWSVIEIEKGEFDCIPNKWFVSPTAAYYFTADYSASAATKLAKNLENAPEDWEIVPVKLRKRNYSTFEKGMSKAVACANEAESASEQELGVGRRKIKAINRLSPDNDSQRPIKKRNHDEYSKEDHFLNPLIPKALRTLQEVPSKENQKVVRQLPNQSPTGSALGKENLDTNCKKTMKKKNVDSYSQEDHFEKNSAQLKARCIRQDVQMKGNKKVARQLTYQIPKVSVLGKESSKKSPRKSPPKKTEKIKKDDELCVLKRKNLKHKCAFDNGPVSLTSVTQSLCYIARLLEGVFGQLHDMKEVLLGQEDEQDDVDSDDETFASFKERLPIFTVKDLLAFDEELSSNSKLADCLGHYIRSKAHRTNPSICATSLVKPVVSKSLTKHLVFKGKSASKQGFVELKFNKIVKSVMKSIYPKLQDAEKVIETSVGRWLTSTASNIRTGRDKSDTPVKDKPHDIEAAPPVDSVAPTSPSASATTGISVEEPIVIDQMDVSEASDSSSNEE